VLGASTDHGTGQPYLSGESQSAEGSSARRVQSRPRIGVWDWTLPCRSHESGDRVTFPVGRQPSGCARGSFPWLQRHSLLEWLNPVRKALAKHLEDWRRSSSSNFALDKATVVAYPIQIDDVRMPPGHRAWEKPTGRTALTVATRWPPPRQRFAASSLLREFFVFSVDFRSVPRG